MNTKNNYFIKIWALALMIVGFAFSASAVVVKPVEVFDTIFVHQEAMVRSRASNVNTYYGPAASYSHDLAYTADDTITASNIINTMPILSKYVLPTKPLAEGEKVFLNLQFNFVGNSAGLGVYILDNQEWSDTDVTWTTSGLNLDDYPVFPYGISADSALNYCADSSITSYIGRFETPKDWGLNADGDKLGDGLYHQFDVTDRVIQAQIAGDSVITFVTHNTRAASTYRVKLNGIQSETPSFLSVHSFEALPYFNNFSDANQSDWLNASSEFANVKNGKIEDGLIFGTYKYQKYTYAPVDETPWIYTTAYPIFAFKLYMKDSVGNICSAYPQDDAASIKFDNKPRNPITTYSADTVNYWDFTSGRLGTSTPDVGVNTSIFMKLPAGITTPDSSVVIDWIGTFANTSELEDFIAIADDATLSDVKLDEVSLAGFDAETYVYDHVVVATVPAVTATLASGSDYASYAVTDATAVPGTTTIVATAADGSTKATYTINFVAPGTPTALAEEAQMVVSVISGQGSITLKNLQGNEMVAIYDLQGRSINSVKASESQLSFDNIKSGVYLIKVGADFTSKAIVY